MKALTADHVSFSYNKIPVIDDVSLEIDDGEFIGIIGPNGAGKSTLLRLLCGILTPHTGIIELYGDDLARMDDRTRARKTAFVPQETYFSADFMVEDIVHMGRFPFLRPFQRAVKDDVDAIDSALILTQTDVFRTRSILSLSSGERQRVVLARALAQKPSILLLDEPSSHLDIHHQQRIMELLRALHDSGIVIIIVHHDLNLANLYCERLVLLHHGRIHTQGSPSTIMTKEVLQAVYKADVTIIEHPHAHVPQIMIKATGGRE